MKKKKKAGLCRDYFTLKSKSGQADQHSTVPVTRLTDERRFFFFFSLHLPLPTSFLVHMQHYQTDAIAHYPRGIQVELWFFPAGERTKPAVGKTARLLCCCVPATVSVAAVKAAAAAAKQQPPEERNGKRRRRRSKRSKKEWKKE